MADAEKIIIIPDEKTQIIQPVQPQLHVPQLYIPQSAIEVLLFPLIAPFYLLNSLLQLILSPLAMMQRIPLTQVPMKRTTIQEFVRDEQGRIIQIVEREVYG